jgi:hypothetical protein
LHGEVNGEWLYNMYILGEQIAYGYSLTTTIRVE